VVSYGYLIVLCRFLSIFMKGKFEDTKRVTKRSKSKKNRHRNGQRKRNNRTNNDL